MKKCLLMFFVACCAVQSHAIELNGKYLSQSGELMFRFTNDSLYIDIAQSRRTVSAFKLVRKKVSEESVTFNAFENYLDNGRMTNREVLIKVTKKDDEEYLLEYFGKDKDRDYNSNERYHIKPID